MKSRYKSILRWLGRALLLVLVLILGAFGYFLINKNSIAKKLVDRINSQITGSILIKDIDLDPFIHFPNVSLRLEGLTFYGTDSNIDSNQKIVALENAYVSFDFWSFLQSEYVLDRITIQSGTVHLIQNKDGTFNLEKALASPKNPSKPIKEQNTKGQLRETTESNSQKDQNSIQSGSGSEEVHQKSQLALNIEKLLISDVAFRVDMMPSEQIQLFRIDQSKASFKYVKDSIEGQLISTIEVDRLGINKDSDIENETLKTDLDFFYDRGDSILNIHRGRIEFRNADFNAQGTVDLREKGQIDLTYSAHDEALTFTHLFLTAEGVENLKSGKIYLNGEVKGEFKDQIPNISCHFGASEMSIEVPNTNEYIRNVKFQGKFNSGVLGDLSKASLVIDTLHAVLPTGFLRAAATIRNFKEAEIAYDLDIAFRLENLAKFVHLGPVEDLHGRIEMRDRYKGLIQNIYANPDPREEEFDIKLDSISFEIPDVVNIDYLKGRLSGNIDNINIDSLYVRSADSDLLVNGDLNKFSHVFFEKDTLLSAEVNIRSGTFNFPWLFRALPKTASSFPYTIKDLDMNVSAETSFQRLANFELVPEMDFDISSMEVRVDSLFQRLSLNDGQFKMFEADSTYYLNFKDFKIGIDDDMSRADFLYAGTMVQKDSMSFKLSTEGLEPDKLFDIKDHTNMLLDNIVLSGDYDGYIVSGKDSIWLIEKAGINATNFAYISTDTIRADKVELSSRNFSYTANKSESIWTNLTSENNLNIQNLNTSYLKSDSLNLRITTQEGIISISPTNTEIFGENNSGIISINMTEDPPRYNIDYSLDDLQLETFLNSFYNQQPLKGTVDVKIALETMGEVRETIESNVSGSIYIAGDSINLIGFDLDKFIKDFQRSQTFDLLDLGAVALAGPAGILYTKGSDYVVLLTSDKGDSTQISRFSSQWDLVKGKISSRDVAFATLKNRVALEGWLDLSTDSLDVTIAVIDKKGCAIVDQRIYGNSKEPEYSKVNFFETLLAPVTNAVKDVVGADCKVFYNGNVLHPEKPKSKK